MKLYKSVLKKTEEYNYKKGISRISIQSNGYKTCKVLYYLSFIWFMIFHGLYILSNTTAFFFYEAAAKNIHMELFVTSIVVFVAMIVANISVKKNWHIPAFVLTLISGIAQITVLNGNDNISLAFLEHGFMSNKFFWYHHAPIILLSLFTLLMAIIGVTAKVLAKKDYNRTLASMFEAYSSTHENVSDAEWNAYLEELDRELEEKKED
ncbi:MAG: hypothetical protein IIX54_06840 [Clostridia bacterium]|nr:hypothetical protein [Clostridia bacterium]